MKRMSPRPVAIFIYLKIPLEVLLGKLTDPNRQYSSQGPVVQKPINGNPILNINRGVYFFTPKCCSTLISRKKLH